MMRLQKLPKDREFYENNYILLNKSTCKIARELNCAQSVVYRKIKRLGLKKDRQLAFKEINKGEKNGIWKGNKVKYAALHIWVKRYKPKSPFCEKCGKITEKLDCANISNKYLRDITDWKWLCRSCHMDEDGRIIRLHKTTPRRKIINGLYICANCKKFKKKEEFSKYSKNIGSIHSYCKECQNNKYNKKNPKYQ